MVFNRKNIIALFICWIVLSGFLEYHYYSTFRQLYFITEIQASRPGSSQIYFDTGSGYNEQESVRLAITRPGYQELMFSLPFTIIFSIRFRPIDAPAVVQMKDVQVRTGCGDLIRKFPAGSFQLVHHIGKMDSVDGTLLIYTTEEGNNPIVEIENSLIDNQMNWDGYAARYRRSIIGRALLGLLLLTALNYLVIKVRRRNNHALVIAWGLFASLSASALLFNLDKVFYTDWNNHLWMMEYYGESLMRTMTVPDIINTRQLIGMPLTLFYAQKFYALSGMVSGVLGSAITVRLLAVMVLLLQYCHVYRAATQFGATRNVSLCLAVMVTWSIYPLTNLYNRGALTEFFAVAFLTCSLASLLCLLADTRSSISRYDMAAMGLFYVAAAVTHPLTAYFGGLFLVIVGVTVLLFSEKERRLRLLSCFSIISLASLLILSPWLYLLCQFKDKLPISSGQGLFQSNAYAENLDNLWSRLSPFPLDLRAIQHGIEGVSTPYLDAQVNLPLLILVGVLIYVGQRQRASRSSTKAGEHFVAWVSAGLLGFAFVLSVCPRISGLLGGFFDVLQFPYRLVAYVNLSALCIAIMLAGRTRPADAYKTQIISMCIAGCIVMSFSALTLKLVHASAISGRATRGESWSSIDYNRLRGLPWSPTSHRSTLHLNELPETFYGAHQYSVVAGYAKLPAQSTMPVRLLAFNVLDGPQFGRVEPLTVTLAEPTFLITNIQSFPWNRLVVNSLPLSQANIFVAKDLLAVLLPQGTHRLEFRLLDDAIWRLLNRLSWVFLFLWITVYMLFAFAQFMRSSSDVPRTTSPSSSEGGIDPHAKDMLS